MTFLAKITFKDSEWLHRWAEGPRDKESEGGRPGLHRAPPAPPHSHQGEPLGPPTLLVGWNHPPPAGPHTSLLKTHLHSSHPSPNGEAGWQGEWHQPGSPPNVNQRVKSWIATQGKRERVSTQTHTNSPSSIIHNSQKMETTQVSINWQMDEQNVGHSYNGVLFGYKKSNTCSNWINPGNMFSEISQTQKPTYCRIPLI